MGRGADEEPVALAVLLPLVVEAHEDPEGALGEQLGDDGLVDGQRIHLLALEERDERGRRSRHRLEVALEVHAVAGGDDLQPAVGARDLVERADLPAAQIREALRRRVLPHEHVRVHVEQRREEHDVLALVADVRRGEDREQARIDLTQQHGFLRARGIEDLDVELEVVLLLELEPPDDLRHEADRRRRAREGEGGGLRAHPARRQGDGRRRGAGAQERAPVHASTR